MEGVLNIFVDKEMLLQVYSLSSNFRGSCIVLPLVYFIRLACSLMKLWPTILTIIYKKQNIMLPLVVAVHPNDVETSVNLHSS
jgi:hypothetical protein